MVEIGYVHSGWSRDRNVLRIRWRQWLESSAIYHPDTDPRIRESCLSLIQSRVKHFSTKWRKLGLWTVEGKHFCVTCRTTEARDRAEDSTVVFPAWAREQTQSEGWNGEFTEVCSSNGGVSRYWYAGIPLDAALLA